MVESGGCDLKAKHTKYKYMHIKMCAIILNYTQQ